MLIEIKGSGMSFKGGGSKTTSKGILYKMNFQLQKSQDSRKTLVERHIRLLRMKYLRKITSSVKRVGPSYTLTKPIFTVVAYYLQWIRSKLIPNLPPQSVIKMDNTLNHNVLGLGQPTSNILKSVSMKSVIAANTNA